MKAGAEDNIAQVVMADPQYQTHYLSRVDDAALQIPTTYNMEIGEILSTPISLISNIDSPEDYKTLVAASSLVRMCKQRLAIIRHHLKGLAYEWGVLIRQATKFIEMKYYAPLSQVRVESKKAIIASALEPISSKVELLEYLVDSADLAQKHLDDINWAVKNSGDLVTNYYAAIRTVSPASLHREI
jgi:hypothetical protein